MCKASSVPLYMCCVKNLMLTHSHLLHWNKKYLVFSTLTYHWMIIVVLILTNLLLNDESVDDEEEIFALSAFIFAVSLFFVSENCVAMTTRHRLIMKKDPIWAQHRQVFPPLPDYTTHHNETYKVYPVPEGVCILHKVHHIRPALQGDDQEYCHPRQANIVKGDCPVERVGRANGTLGIVLEYSLGIY